MLQNARWVLLYNPEYGCTFAIDIQNVLNYFGSHDGCQSSRRFVQHK